MESVLQKTKSELAIKTLLEQEFRIKLPTFVCRFHGISNQNEYWYLTTLHTERKKKSYFDIVLEECCIIEQVD